MQRVKLSEHVELSRIVYGMWRIGDDADKSAGHIQAKIEACLEQGITSIDQADIYGGYMAEELLGSALKAAPALKDKVEIVTKCGIIFPAGRYEAAPLKHYNTTAEHITQSVENSLKLMDIEKIDLLLIHRPDPFMDQEVTGRALDKLVSEGKVKAIGVSNFKAHDWNLLQSSMHNKLITNQIEISLIENQAFTNGDLAFLQERKIAPMAWSPLAGGALFDNKNKALSAALEKFASQKNTDITSIAIAWLLAHPSNIIPVLGTNNLDRISNMSSAMDVSLSREDWFELYEQANGYEVP